MLLLFLSEKGMYPLPLPLPPPIPVTPILELLSEIIVEEGPPYTDTDTGGDIVVVVVLMLGRGRCTVVVVVVGLLIGVYPPLK